MLVDEGHIDESGLSLPAVIDYLKAHPEEVLRILYANSSYVFYQTDGETHRELKPELYPSGSLGFPVTTGRSIATDKRYFPGGALAFIQGQQNLPGAPAGPVTGFVIDQDTGGAITEAHIDVFMGAGEGPGARAGLLNDSAGRLYFIVLKR